MIRLGGRELYGIEIESRRAKELAAELSALLTAVSGVLAETDFDVTLDSFAAALADVAQTRS